ncbi:zinc finger protein 862-like [Lissotriton helveticus]
MVILRNRSAAARFGFGVRAMLTETATDKANRMEVVERQRSMPEEIKILINNVLLAVKMNTSMLSVQDIHDPLALYVKIPDSWRSKNYAFEFLEAINSVIHCEAMTELRQALYHTLIIDESTDISVTKMLILYFKFRPVTSTEHKTQFGGIVKLTSCNAEAITTAVKEFYTANELDLMKMVMFTSDGASVMLGKNNGVATRLKQSIPHLVEQHCVAHREDLGVDDAWKRVPMIKEMETLLRTVYTVFSRSPARKSKLDEIASVTECEVVSFRPLNEVRWLSRHFAVGALIRNYEIVLKYFEHEKVEENDPIAKYCYKKLSDSNYHISLAVLNDILGEFASLCKLFQKSSLTTVEAVQYARAKIGQTKQQYLGDTVFWSSNVRELMVLYKERQEFDSGPILSFVSLLSYLNAPIAPKYGSKASNHFSQSTGGSPVDSKKEGAYLNAPIAPKYGSKASNHFSESTGGSPVDSKKEGDEKELVFKFPSSNPLPMVTPDYLFNWSVFGSPGKHSRCSVLNKLELGNHPGLSIKK